MCLISAKRLVKLNFVDNTIKLGIDNFEINQEKEVFSSFDFYDYKLYDALNVELNFDEYTKNRVIVYTDSKGVSSNVDNVNMNKIGVYKIQEQIIYGDEASYPLAYEIVVKDTKAPVLVLDGSNEIVVKKGEKIECWFSKKRRNYKGKIH